MYINAKSISLPFFSLIISIIICSPASIFAEEGVLEEIIVTAQFRKQNLQDTPLAITAMPDEMLNARNQTSILQVSDQAPNVEFREAPSGFGPSLNVFIRGIGQPDWNYAMEPGVGMYVDDIYLSTLHGGVLDLLDLERVEILRGPQGTLMGRNNIGGAVRLISRKPSGDGPGYVELSYGKYDLINARGAVEFTLIPGRLVGRISGVTRHQDGYQDRLDYACTHPGATLDADGPFGPLPTGPFPSMLSGSSTSCKLGTAGGRSYTGGRATFVYTPNDRLEITVIGDVMDDNSEVPASTLVAARPIASVPGYGPQFVSPNPFVSYSTFADTGYATPGFLSPTPFLPILNPNGPLVIPPVNKIFHWGIAGIIDYRINENLSLKSITAYREFETLFADDPDGSPLPAQTILNNTFHDGIQQELRLNGSGFGKMLDYTLGFFYFEQTNRQASRTDIPWSPSLGRMLDLIIGDVTYADTWAVFGHGVYHINDRLNLTAGIRYTEENKDYLYRRRDPGNNAPNIVYMGIDGITGRFNGDNVDYRASIDYRWSDQVMTYATYSTGFRGGGVNPRPFFPAQVVPFKKETLENFEGGVKSDLLDNRLRLNGAGFYSFHNDLQIAPPSFTCPDLTGVQPCFAPRNLADAEGWGAEMEAAFTPIADLSFDASLSWIDSKLTRLGLDPNGGINRSDPSVTDPVTGKLLINADQHGIAILPAWTFSIGGQYTVSLGEYGTFTPRFDVYYQDALRISKIFKSYTTLNLSLGWRSMDEKWEAMFAVANATDEEYFLNGFDLLVAAGFANAQPAAPREWSIKLRRNFN